MDRLTLKYLVLQKILRCSLKRSNFEELDSHILTKSENLIGTNSISNLESMSVYFKIINKQKNKIINLNLELIKNKENITKGKDKLEYLKKEKELKDLLEKINNFNLKEYKIMSKNYYHVARRILNGQIN